MALLEVERLTVTYGRDDYAVTPLDGFDMTVAEGKLAVLLGPSGCGKTTLLSCLSGIQRPASGAIRFGTVEVTALDNDGLAGYRRDTVGIVFQAFNLVPSLDAAENVMVPLRSSGVSRREARARAVKLLEDVGLGERVHHHPGGLSGGQQQRVAIARALALNPPLIVADEPTASLDHVQVEVVLRILRGLTARGCTVIVSTHDNRLIPLADQLVEMQPHAVATAATSVLHEEFAAGDVVFEQESFGDRIYDLVEGTVEVSHLGPDGAMHVLGTKKAGEQFGEMGPLFQLPRSATVRAATAARIDAYTVDAFREKFGGAHLIALVAQYSGSD